MITLNSFGIVRQKAKVLRIEMGGVMIALNSFGMPSNATHYFVVDVPSKRESTVRVIEVTNDDRGEQFERASIDRDKWIDIRDDDAWKRVAGQGVAGV